MGSAKYPRAEGPEGFLVMHLMVPAGPEGGQGAGLIPGLVALRLFATALKRELYMLSSLEEEAARLDEPHLNLEQELAESRRRVLTWWILIKGMTCDVVRLNSGQYWPVVTQEDRDFVLNLYNGLRRSLQVVQSEDEISPPWGGSSRQELDEKVGGRPTSELLADLRALLGDDVAYLDEEHE